MGINMGSIMAKVNAFAKSSAGKRRIAAATGGAGGGGSVNLEERRAEMIAAGQEMVALLRQHASGAGLPASVMDHIESFIALAPIIDDDGSGSLAITMTSNPSRPSLYPEKYDGAYNIVAIFNNGYEASNVVYGRPEVEVEGQLSIDGFFYAKSKQHRDGLGFMQDAVADFNAKFGGKYNVKAVLSGMYG